MVRYNPNARKPPATVGPSRGTTDPTRGYANQDGPGNTTIDYGPHRGGFTPPTQPMSYVDHATPFFDQQHAGDVQRRADLLAGNDAYQQAKASGDLRGAIAAMQAMRGQMQQDRFVAQGGTPETWANRYSNENNWPRPTSSIGYSHGPGRPDYATRDTNPSPYGPGNTAPPPSNGVRRGATPQANAPMSGGMPPMQNPMFEGYQGGGAGVTNGPGGWGSAGGMPMGGGNPFATTGGNPGAWMQGGGETGMMYPGGGMSGGVSPQLINMLMQMRGGGMGAMPMGGNMGMMGGGYNPYASLGMY